MKKILGILMLSMVLIGGMPRSAFSSTPDVETVETHNLFSSVPFGTMVKNRFPAAERLNAGLKTMVRNAAQPKWTKYEGNPVLGGLFPDWAGDPSVIRDGDILKMWMTGGYPNSGYDPLCQIGYATSVDGIHWIPHPGPVLHVGGPGEWDRDGVETVCVIKDVEAPHSERYKMWFYGENPDYTAIGYATSSDGINWTKYAKNPVLLPGPAGSWDAAICGPTVIKDYDAPPSERYKMWYTGLKIEFIGEISVTWAIGYATSPDGINWTKYPGNPVLEQGPPGAWDAYFVCEPSVIKTRGMYEMWHSGAPGHENFDPINVSIGYATSNDGINWKKQGLVLKDGAPGEWDDVWTAFPTVILEDTLYRMWYGGADKNAPHTTTLAIGYAWAQPERNVPPATPNRPSGPTSGKVGEKYTYTTSAVDQDGDKIKYGWDWDGDQIVDEWTKLYDSGATIEITHSWDEEGTYEIRVKAKDEHGSESNWSEPLTVSIPKTHNIWNLIKQISNWFMKTFRRNIIQYFGG
jgi:hypothetical protein